MKLKKTSLVILTAILIISCKNKLSETNESSESNIVSNSFLSKEYIENYTYRIENNDIKLTNGKLKTEYENYSIVDYDLGDVNNDKVNDLFILLKNSTNGSGTFYYTNLLVGSAQEGLEFVEEKFIGDRIKLDFLTIYKNNEKHPVTDVNIESSDIGTIGIGYYKHSEAQAYGEEPELYTTSEWRLINGKMTGVN